MEKKFKKWSKLQLEILMVQAIHTPEGSYAVFKVRAGCVDKFEHITLM
jgi:hypothetical protein